MFTMLSFALQYRKVIAEFTSNRANNVRWYELDDDEWQLVEHLSNILKVHTY